MGKIWEISGTYGKYFWKIWGSNTGKYKEIDCNMGKFGQKLWQRLSTKVGKLPPKK